MLLKAFLFGQMHILQGGRPLKLPPSVHARSLLAYLLMHKKESLPRLFLADTLWPEMEESSALRKLSQALWLARKSFPELIDANRQSVRIQDDTVWVDVEEFQGLIKSRELSLLHRAIDLYKGELLEGFYEDWLFTLREQLREEYLQVLEQIALFEKRGGHFDEALSYTKLLVHADPLREEAHCELMRLYMVLEQPEAALRQFEICREILTNELNSEPDEKTIQIAEKISQHISLSSEKQHVTKDAAFFQNPSLIGREEERKLLLNHVENMFNGDGWVVLLEGEAGVGKTRLLEEISGDVEWRGGQVLWGRGKEREVTSPFGPLVEAISNGLTTLRVRQLIQTVPKTWLQVLKPIIPKLASLQPGLPSATPLDSDQEGTRLLEAIISLLEEWNKITPIVLILEDLHWFDRDTLNLLPALVNRIDQTKILLIITYRSEEARTYPFIWEKLQQIDKVGRHERLQLSRLNASACSELIRQYLGIERDAPIFASRLYKETEGNPLFILETLRTLYDEGLLLRDETGDWSTPWDETTVDYAELPLPSAVERVIARRLERVDLQMRQVLNIAAVLGSQFDFEWLAASTGMEMNNLLKTIGDLIRRNFWLESSQAYRFVHDKIRQVTYQMIPSDDLIRLHRQAGETLEKLHPDRNPSLSHYFFEGHKWDKAAEYSIQAGDQATKIYANQEALAFYNRALISLEKTSSPSKTVRSFDVHLAREAVYARLGEREDQSKELKKLKVLAAPTGETEQDKYRNLAQVALRQAQFSEATGDSPGSITAAQTAVKNAELAQNIQIQAAGYLEWGVGLWREGKYEISRTQLEQALILSRAANSGHLEADSLRNLGNICWFQGNYEGANDFYKKTLIVCRKNDDFLGEARTLNNLGVLAEHQADYRQAREYFSQSIKIHEKIGDRRGLSNTLANLANIDLYQGNYLQAKRNYELALPIRQNVGDREGEAIVLVNLGLVWNQLGNYTPAEDYFENSLKIFQDIDSRWGAGYVLGFLGLQAHQLGDNDTALNFCQQAAKAANELEIAEHEGQALTFLGVILTEINRLDEAEQTLQKAIGLRKEVGHLHLIAETQAGLARLYLIQRDLSQAQIYVDSILDYLKNGSVDGTDEPANIYLTCYRVMRKLGDSRADDILLAGHKFIKDRAARIDDPIIKKTYLENVPAHREILAAYQQLQEQKIRVRLPKIEAPMGRSLNPDEWIEVAWSVNASEDRAFIGKVAIRQHRLRRLLREANSQGAAPTVADLASALEVSPATVKRDLAALREKGLQVHTRGSRKRAKK